MSYILIIMYSTIGIVRVDSYPSKEACTDAGKAAVAAYEENLNGGGGYSFEFICVPGGAKNGQ